MAEAEWEDAPVSTGEEMKEIVATAEVLNGGAPQVPVVQRRTAFQTAVAVIKPRNLKLVEQEIMLESESAGEEFFYSIPFKKKDGSVENVRDGSIDLAYAFMRAMGNCGITSDVNDVVAPDGHHWEFTSTFIDLEKGANYERTVRRKAGHGVLAGLAKKDPQRVYDMRFGAAQSISQRNAIKAGVPGWLWKRAVAKSIDAATAAIRKETPAVAIEKAVKHFAGMGVTLEMVEKALGKTKDAWDVDEILKLRGYATAIKDGQTSAEGIFGKPTAPEPEKPETPNPEAAGGPVEAPKSTKKKAGPEKPEVSAGDLDYPQGPGESEPSRAAQRPGDALQGEAEPTPPAQESKPAPGLTFPELMDTLKKNPGLQFAEGTVVRSQAGATLAVIKGVEWGGDGAAFVKVKFAPNLEQLANGLTVEQVVNSFKSAGIAIEDEDAPLLTPPPAQEKKRRSGGRPTAADVREECRKLMEEKGLSWESAARFFPAESLDALPDNKLQGVLNWLKSQP